MDEHIETTEPQVNPYEGLNTLQPERFDWETPMQYKMRRFYNQRTIKAYSKGRLVWKSKQIDTKDGDGATFIKKDVEEYLKNLKQEEDHVN
tara:strand:+ start:180 stop:452 length:273 start_codon:yes stop_codon:yes gene_type:complete